MLAKPFGSEQLVRMVRELLATGRRAGSGGAGLPRAAGPPVAGEPSTGGKMPAGHNRLRRGAVGS